MIKRKNKYTFIDLFAGCGGLSEGFLQTSEFEGLAHVEWELPMVNTLRHRLTQKWDHTEEESKKRVIHFDIQKSNELIHGNWSKESISVFGSTNHLEIVSNGLKGIVGDQKVDLIIGGPPCQAYSIAGRAQDKNSMKEDYRNFLFESFVKVVDAFQPSTFVFENVPGMLSAMPGNKLVSERIFEAFEKSNYEIRFPSDLKQSIYTASDFGVPQKRNRVIIIGVKKGCGLDLEEIYNQINSFKTDKIKTVQDAIGYLPSFVPLNSIKKANGKNISHELKKDEEAIKFHEPRFHNDRDVRFFKEWLKLDMNNKSSVEKINFYNERLSKQSKHAKYRNLEWDKPSPTIVAHLYKDGLMFLHPDEKQARSITVKEAALLQSFPEDFEFIGSQGVAFKMIGNAVPPELAKNIGLGIIKELNKL
jgi:DNA (cytosine-5)-methyltransferase 1